MAAVAAQPENIKSLFQEESTNVHGAYTIKLFVRGKPWLVQIDDFVLQNLTEGETWDDR